MKLRYRAYDSAGKSVAAAIDAASESDAIELLRRQGLFVTEIAASKSADSDRAAPARRGRRKGKLQNVAMFTRQLHVLVSTGTPLSDALHALEKQMRDVNFREVVKRLRQRVEEGSSLADAMADEPSFDAIYRALVAAGESSGNFPAMLDRLAVLARKSLQVRNQIRGAMVYPALLILISLGVFIGMILFVLPRFAELFETLDVELPPSTMALMVVSGLLRSYWWAVIAGLVGGGYALKAWLGTSAGKRFMDSLTINIPVIGKAVREFTVARIARVLGTLVQSYVPLLDALKLTRHASGNMHYEKLLADAETAVTEGEAISTVLSASPLVPASVAEAVKHGEQSGKVGPLLLNLADFLDEDNETFVKSITSIIEPVILIVMGLLVGLVAMAMFLPLFDLAAGAGAQG